MEGLGKLWMREAAGRSKRTRKKESKPPWKYQNCEVL
jgi:hypothetical protein